MDYQQITFNMNSSEEYIHDLLIDALAQIGFDSFEDDQTGFKAYIPAASFNKASLDDVLHSFENLVSFSYKSSLIPSQNWNKVWENNFQPLIISNQCYIRATFHNPCPDYPYEIIIDPKMAFGTGHHQTTALMVEWMLSHDFNGKKVLDMGCGTGILAILASKLGADSVVAIDHDDICFASTIENAKLNQVDNILTLCGATEMIPPQTFDIILANINRNVLLDHINSYRTVLAVDGTLLLSGFYEGTDLDIIVEKASVDGLKYFTHKTSDVWVAAKFVPLS